MISNQQINSYFSKHEKDILKKYNRKKIDLSKEWIKDMPSEAGVYAVFEKGKLVYIGETGNIQGRVKDMKNTLNHQLRRNIGRKNFSNVSGYKDANSKIKFPPHIEERIDRWIKNKLEIGTIPLKLGRKELEEHVCGKHNPKYNQRGRRR